MSDLRIKIDQLRVIYNQGRSNEVRSLDGVNAEIYSQEYVIIYGPSGCGKSTLLYGISGLQAPTYGDVIVGGKNLSKMTKKEKVQFHQTSIGMVFQAFYLIDTLTVIDNVCLPKVFRGESLVERREAAMKLLQRFGISEQADKFPSQLSGGQKQRVSIARALVNNPQIILADEPVGNLDSESAQNVLDIFKEINEIDKKTVIMVTHNPEHLVYADRIIHMKDGKIIKQDINRDKRPPEAAKRDSNMVLAPVENIPTELRLLMRTFRGLSLKQAGVLLIPFKAKQLMSHILSELTDEQVSLAENLVKDFLFDNLDNEELKTKLDLEMEKGGAGWNRLRASSFAEKVNKIVRCSELIENDREKSFLVVADYLIWEFKLKLEKEALLRFRAFIRLRINNIIDRIELKQKLDEPIRLDGVGLYSGTAEKIVREMEVIMLLSYSNNPV